MCLWTLWTLSLSPSLSPQVQPDWLCRLPLSRIIAKALRGKSLGQHSCPDLLAHSPAPSSPLGSTPPQASRAFWGAPCLPRLRSSPALPPQSPRVLGLGTQLYLGWDLSAPALGFRVSWSSHGRHSRGPLGTSRGAGGAARGAGRVASGSRRARWHGEPRPPRLSWKVEVPGRARSRQGLHLRAEKKVRRSATLQTPRPLVSKSPAPP